MARIIRGERVGRAGKIGVGCSAAIFDEKKECILLIRRADNGKWAVPGGYMEAGENLSEACAREVFEETGLQVAVSLVSVYTNPNLLLEYLDGNRWQLVILHFEAQILGGELRPSSESPDLKFFRLAELDHLDMSMLDRLRAADAYAQRESAIIRDEFEL